jgi:uncharacterized protein YsxB (DUF464 family)
MVLVEFKKNNNVSFLRITGHADFAEHGSDIVCAGISTLAYSIGNKILNMDENFNLEVNENEFKFNNDMTNLEINLLLDTLYEGLLMIEHQYPENITFKEV